METDKLAKTAKFVDNWWKILSALAVIVVLIYNISAQWIKVKEMEEQNKIRDERSEKRYERATEMYNELKEHGIVLTKEYQKHLVEDAYFRGRTEAKIEDLELDSKSK